MGLLGIHHVQLAMPAGKEPEAREFYAVALGLEEIQKPPVLAARGGAWFGADGVQLHLGVEEDFRPARRAHPAIQVSDLEAVADKLEARGFAVSYDHELPGFNRFYVSDPFGNRLEFLEPSPGG